MTTAERIHLLRRHGLENAVVAAVLGVDVTEIVANVQDPSHEVTVGGGGSVDLTAITGPLGFAGGPSFAWGDSEQWGPGYPVLSVLGLGDPFFSELDVVDGSMGTVAADGSSWAFLGPGGTISMKPSGVAALSVSPGAGETEFSILANGAHHWQRSATDVATDSRFLETLIWGEAHERFRADIDGSLHWSGGAAIYDTNLQRTAPGTLEIDNTLSFKGADGDATAGAILFWDDDFYGMMLKGRPGSNDAELYVVNPDVAHAFANIYPSAFLGRADADNFIIVDGQPGGNSNIRFASSGQVTDLKSAGSGLLEILDVGVGPSGLICRSPDGTRYKLTPPNGGGAATWVAA